MLVAEMHVERVETKEEIQAEIVRVFGESAKDALCIAKMESGFRADAVNSANTNGTADIGVFQINDIHGMSWASRMDARTNIAKAKEIRDAWGSWDAWMAAPKCGL